MELITFELPEIIYKITRKYDIGQYSYLEISNLKDLTYSFYFKDINLAQDFLNKNDGKLQSVTIVVDEEELEVELRSILTFDVINAYDIIPNVIGLYL
jgi:hypothetical protein